MKKTFVLIAVFALLSLTIVSQAIVIETVAIGNAGNAGELSGTGAGGYGPDRICGSVAYNYSIGKYEVTAGQYTAFLNAVAGTDTYLLYNTQMSNNDYGCGITRSWINGRYTYSVASDFVNHPVNYVSYWDSCRFVNWLNNGQLSGAQNASTTERGAYTLDGYNDKNGRTIQRNPGASWAITSEDEWYKAAYYKGDGCYSIYANGTGTLPVAGTASNYNDIIGHTWDGTINGALEQNGTKDMMGNVWEWNEAIVIQDSYSAYHGVRGGSFINSADYVFQASNRYNNYYFNSDGSADYLGFRVSQVPEPSSIIVLFGGLAGLLGIRRRRT